MPRMRILTASEQEVFDKPPLFDHRERKHFFSLPKGLMDIVTTLRTPCGQIGLLLMCGYFKATKRFYQPLDFHERDIEAAAKILELHLSDFSSDAYAKQTRAHHQQLILDFQGFAPFDEAAKKNLASEIATMAGMHLKPRLIFDLCSDFLIQHRLQIPQSGTLLELIRLGLQATQDGTDYTYGPPSY
ncbi:MAG: DUF4158 domain-containing protein [Desulfobulbus sp.]